MPEPLSETTAEFGKRVRTHRHALGLSQEKMAEGTSLHWSYIGRLERGLVNPTLHTILAVARVLDVDPGELLSGLGRN